MSETAKSLTVSGGLVVIVDCLSETDESVAQILDDRGTMCRACTYPASQPRIERIRFYPACCVSFRNAHFEPTQNRPGLHQAGGEEGS